MENIIINKAIEEHDKNLALIKDLPLWKKFEALDSEGNKVRCIKDGKQEEVFVCAKGKSRYGNHWSVESFIAYYKPLNLSDEDKDKKWHKKLATIEKRLNASGLWPELREIAHNLQAMTKKEFDMLVNADYNLGRKLDDAERKDILNSMLNKYPFLKKPGTNELNRLYTEEWTEEPRTKSMNFGAWHQSSSENIKRALNEKRSVTVRGCNGYDVTFSYDADSNKAWYSEEYKGTGNGHYYLALDGTMALKYEDD